jgi:hypothetical protein
MAGYSATPLISKLGLKPPLKLLAIDAPKEYRGWIGELPAGVSLVRRWSAPIQAAHIFSRRKGELKKHLVRCRKALAPSGFVWVSWPKQASKVETDITEDVIREIALPLGFVDIKVCAVSDVWSGLKLVIRKSERT